MSDCSRRAWNAPKWDGVEFRQLEIVDAKESGEGMSLGEGNLRERVDELERENEQLKDFAAHMYKHIRGLSDALFVVRGEQVTVNAERAARLKTDEMRFRLSAKAFGIEVES